MTDLSTCAANICVGVTARPLGGVELFLNVVRRAEVGCKSCRQIPASLREDEVWTFVEPIKEAISISDSIALRCVQQRRMSNSVRPELAIIFLRDGDKDVITACLHCLFCDFRCAFLALTNQLPE